MTEAELKLAKRNNLNRRIIAVRNELNIPAWPIKETNRLSKRLMYAPGDGINDFDLRVMVRWFNRELIGRSVES